MQSHLEYANQSYFEHFKDSIVYSAKSLKASVFFLIHAFIPNTFQHSGSQTIEELNLILKNKIEEIQKTKTS